MREGMTGINWALVGFLLAFGLGTLVGSNGSEGWDSLLLAGVVATYAVGFHVGLAVKGK